MIGKIQCCSSGRKIWWRKDGKSHGTLENKKVLVEFQETKRGLRAFKLGSKELEGLQRRGKVLEGFTKGFSGIVAS